MTIAARDPTPPGRAPRLRREILLALAVKAALLLAIYLSCFSPAGRTPSDASATAAALVGSAATGNVR